MLLHYIYCSKILIIQLKKRPYFEDSAISHRHINIGPTHDQRWTGCPACLSTSATIIAQAHSDLIDR